MLDTDHLSLNLRGHPKIRERLVPIPADEIAITIITDSICQGLKLQRIRAGSQDLRIAAITLANRAILVTRNRIDFANVPGLMLADWTI